MRALFRCLALGILLLTCACGSGESLDQSAQAVPGVSDYEVLFGSSLALSGHAGYLGTQTLRGALSYIREVNESGGVNERQIRVIAYDDAYDPPQCLSNTQRLIVDDQVFGLFCYVGTPTTVKIVPFVERVGIPLVGMFTGANALRTPFNRYLVNVRASYYQETRAAVEHLVRELGMTRIAVFYQYDAYGFDGLTGTELALKELGLEPVARASYIRGSMSVDKAAERILETDPEAVVMIGTYDPCAEFVHLASSQGRHPLFYAVSFVGADELARKIGHTDQAVIMSQVVPPPQGASAGHTPGCAQEYVRLLAKHYPGDTPNSVGLEGFINAKVLVEGLKRAGRDLTRDGFLTAIETMSAFKLGPDITLSFGPMDHQGSDKVFFTRLEEGRFVLFDDWKGLSRAIDAPHPEVGQ